MNYVVYNSICARVIAVCLFQAHRGKSMLAQPATAVVSAPGETISRGSPVLGLTAEVMPVFTLMNMADAS